MSNTVVRVIANRRVLKEAAYAGNIGIMELIKFKQKASDSQKKQFDAHVKNKKHKEAWELVQHVTGVKLHKSVHEGVGQLDEVSVAKYKHLGATNNTTHFIKNIKTGEVVSPHRSRQDAEDSMVSMTSDHRIVRAKKTPVKEEVKSDILPKSGAGQDGTDTLLKSYMRDTPGQGKKVKSFKDYSK